MRIKTLHALTFAVVVCLLAATPAFASTSFSDSTFNLSDYGPLQQYLGNPDMSGSVQHSVSFGNPAPSVEFIVHWPGSPNTDVAYQGLIHNGWSYDPGTQGALTSIDFAEDKYIHTDGNWTLTGSNIRMLMLQGGNYYIAAIPVTIAFDTWESGSGNLTATNFNYFDFATGILDNTRHPDFSSGMMQFGLANYFGLQLNGPTEVDTYYDNLSINLNQAVPEPSSLLLLGSGIVGVAGMVRRKLFS
jgi:hypothetical protein